MYHPDHMVPNAFLTAACYKFWYRYDDNNNHALPPPKTQRQLQGTSAGCE